MQNQAATSQKNTCSVNVYFIYLCTRELWNERVEFTCSQEECNRHTFTLKRPLPRSLRNGLIQIFTCEFASHAEQDKVPTRTTRLRRPIVQHLFKTLEIATSAHETGVLLSLIRNYAIKLVGLANDFFPVRIAPVNLVAHE